MSSLIKLILPDEEERRNFRGFRRAWIPAIKTLIATAADVFGDWIFYIRTRKDGDENAAVYEKWLFFFCLVSSILGSFTLITVMLKSCEACVTKENSVKAKFIHFMSYLLGMEIFLEDIPQMWLTTMVLKVRANGWTPVGVFNLTTSAFNFTFSVLDMMMPLDEQTHIEKKRRKQTAVEYQNKVMAQQWTRVDDPKWTSNTKVDNSDYQASPDYDHHDEPNDNCRNDPHGPNTAIRNASNEADRIRLHQQWIREDAFMPQDFTQPETDYNMIQ